MRRLAFVCSVLGTAFGCRQLLGLHELSGDASASIRDAGADSNLFDAPFGCLGTGVFTLCPPNDVPASVLVDGTVDTGSSLLCARAQPTGWVERGQPASCFIFGDQIQLATNAGELVVTGSRPLVIAATSTIVATELVDASSHLGGTSGPGANSNQCATLVSGGSGAGAAGGSFGTAGGDGGDNGNLQGQQAGAPMMPAVLRGGCPGGRVGALATLAAASGGAVYLAAGSSITIHAGIDASGAGGTGGLASSGGNGGGAGGMIVMIAPAIDLTGADIYADGGGGGAGGTAAAGSDGADPDGTATCCAGGLATVGSGGAGAHDGAPAGAGGSAGGASSGGGGGGGAGYIVLFGSNTGTPARISPAAQ